MSRIVPKQLSDEEFEALDLDAIRCTGCTPCCMGHVHFLHDNSVIWACQTKLERTRQGDTMAEAKELTLPCTREELAELESGDKVLLTGTMYTMRDAGHARCLEYLNEHGELPFGLEGQVLFYAGPTGPTPTRPFGAIGPTTASRMDFATPALMDAGIMASIGKGKRSEAVREACVRNGGVYFAAVGGVAALLAESVKSSETIAWEDLGTEALRRISVEDFPCYVDIDTKGNRLYE